MSFGGIAACLKRHIRWKARRCCLTCNSFPLQFESASSHLEAAALGLFCALVPVYLTPIEVDNVAGNITSNHSALRSSLFWQSTIVLAEVMNRTLPDSVRYSFRFVVINLCNCCSNMPLMLRSTLLELDMVVFGAGFALAESQPAPEKLFQGILHILHFLESQSRSRLWVKQSHLPS